MNELLSRRKLIKTGLAAAAGVSGMAVAARLADQYGLIPPDHGGIFGVGETLTYAAQRLLMSNHPLAREFNRSQISNVSPVNGPPPENETYQRLLAGGFAEWRLVVDGLVARPSSFSLAELKLSFAQPDHPSSLRRRLVLYCRMDRRPSLLCIEFGRNPPAGKVRSRFSLRRRRMGEYRHGRRLASANLSRLRHEWPGTAHTPWRSCSSKSCPPARV